MTSTRLALDVLGRLLALGVTDAVLAPGSRSGPIALVLHEAERRGQVRLHVRVDEREAGYARRVVDLSRLTVETPPLSDIPVYIYEAHPAAPTAEVVALALDLTLRQRFDTDLDAYFALCEKRFANPKIGDTVRRLALDGSNRQPKFIIPSALDRIRDGQSVTGLALVSALWCRYCFGTTDSGAVIEPNDPNWDRLNAQAIKARDNPKAWLEMADIYGDLAKAPDFIAAFTKALNALWTQGTARTIEGYLADQH